MSIWDDPELQTDELTYFKFERIGDTAAGTIKEIKRHTFDDGKSAAQLALVGADGSEFIVTAGQTRLRAAMKELRPEPGDWISIRLTHIEKRPGGRTLKHFDVQATRNGVPLAPAPAPVGSDNVIDQAVLAALTDAQRQALLSSAPSAPPF